MTTPTEFGRLAIRAAAKVHERLQAREPLNCADRFPGAAWDQLRRTLWRHRQMEVRGWQTAARSLLPDLDYQTGLLITLLQHFRSGLPSSERAYRIVAPNQIVADLTALEGEFESARIDLKEGTITVETEPIELDNLWLGPFDICLWWERLGVRRAYEVIAKDPQRPAKDDSVTHPHVQDRQLCEGDATLPIKAALAEGRLFDFFLLVRQTLQTYNSSSPYVQISEWAGIHCQDCGWTMEEEDARSCDRCDGNTCSECSTYCRNCDRYVCHGCAGECAQCERTFCEACLTLDDQTQRLLCKTCLEQGANCDDDDQGRPAAAADAVCLGQTAAAA
jgi:hypothetical protein